jgi:hexosaminidase
MSKELSTRGGGNEGVTQVERLLLLQNGYNTVLSNGYYIDLMLSVDSHYLNDPLPKIVLFSGRKGANTGREAAMWSELAAL